MEYFRIKSLNMDVSRICMGGSSPKSNYLKESHSIDAFIETLHKAYSLGVNFFDSSENYGGGDAETLLGNTAKDFRDQVVLTSKAAWENAEPKDLRVACEKSLKRLQTEYIDIYYLHYPNPWVPIGQTMETLMQLKEEGKIRAIGLSNFSLSQLQSACQYGEVSILQQCYSLLWRSYAERHLFPFCVEKGIKVVTYGPLASGLLSGKFDKETKFTKEDQRARTSEEDGLVPFLPRWWKQSIETVDKFKDVERPQGISLAQMAIHWALRQQAVDAVIVGGTTIEAITENIESINVQCSAKSLEQLDALSMMYTSAIPEYVNYYLRMKKHITTEFVDGNI
ncbi:MAG: aldo/keto reductase [Sphaerochaeta sp.]